jgi:hypothetical protein
MTPKQFHDTYRWVANLVSAGTGIDPLVLLAQWANETAWGSVVVGNNLGNIRCSPTNFCQYTTLRDFIDACIACWHNGYYGAVLAAVGPAAQLAAIVASPWDSGHYGGSLQPFYSQLEAFDMTPDQDAKLEETRNKVNEVWDLLTRGTHAPQNPNWIRDELEAIRAEVRAITGVGGGLTSAQAAQLTDIETRLTNLTLKVA